MLNFESQKMTTLSTTKNPTLMDSHGRKQHLTYGNVVSGSMNNTLCYGSEASYKNMHHKKTAKLDRPNTPPKFMYGHHDTAVGSTKTPRWNSESAEVQRKKKQADEARKQHEYMQDYQDRKKRRTEEEKEEKRMMLEQSKHHPLKLAGWGQHNSKPHELDPGKNQVMEFGRHGGGGAPNKTNSGKLIHGKRDPTIYFGQQDAGQSDAMVTDLERMAHQTRNDRNVKKQVPFETADSINEGTRPVQKYEEEFDPGKGVSILTQMGKPGGGNPLRDANGNAFKKQTLHASNDGAMSYGHAMHKKPGQVSADTADHPLGRPPHQQYFTNNLWGGSAPNATSGLAI